MFSFRSEILNKVLHGYSPTTISDETCVKLFKKVNNTGCPPVCYVKKVDQKKQMVYIEATFVCVKNGITKNTKMKSWASIDSLIVNTFFKTMLIKIKRSLVIYIEKMEIYK